MRINHNITRITNSLQNLQYCGPPFSSFFFPILLCEASFVFSPLLTFSIFLIQVLSKAVLFVYLSSSFFSIWIQFFWFVQLTFFFCELIIPYFVWFLCIFWEILLWNGCFRSFYSTIWIKYHRINSWSFHSSWCGRNKENLKLLFRMLQIDFYSLSLENFLYNPCSFIFFQGTTFFLLLPSEHCTDKANSTIVWQILSNRLYWEVGIWKSLENQTFLCLSESIIEELWVCEYCCWYWCELLNSFLLFSWKWCCWKGGRPAHEVKLLLRCWWYLQGISWKVGDLKSVHIGDAVGESNEEDRQWSAYKGWHGLDCVC